ncbi:LysR family transcriptional regulator [Streptomyces sp. LP11]|uniref:LysR family transcriptional regulator n=1 Tax=Streptomyces pyxinicus TaxID=2970331 RepID=A0ABT2AU27_9ACTN|nr:LysR family transcriptional regulator [Streptomyces sp. LP11]MCS0599749.1 LysR family transcriptional regulator [Streptomyces sp. LP11]
MALELRQLRVVAAIADTGSLTGAARRLGMAQPSVSQSLALAERAVGGPLFLRGSRGAVPTSLGEAVVGHARAVLDAMERMAAAVVRHRKGDWPAAVRIGCAPGLLVAHLSVAVPLVAGSDVQITTAAGTAGHLAALAAGRIEAALITRFPMPGETARAVGDGEGALRGSVVAVDPLFAGVSARHPLAAGPEADLAELAGERWCLPPGSDDDLGTQLTEACRRAGHPAALVGADYAAALALVREGGAVMPMMPGSRTGRDLVLLPLRGEPLSMVTLLYWRPGGPLPEEWIRNLWERLVRAQRDIIEAAPAYCAWLAGHPYWRTTPRSPVAVHQPRG